jgi:hypothetical protein
MNASEAGVLVTVVLAVVAIAGLWLFRQRAKIRIKGPGKSGLDLDVSNDPKAAINVDGAKSRAGGFTGVDATGRGIDLKDVAVEKDISATVKPKVSPKA